MKRQKEWTKEIGVDGLTFGERLKDLITEKGVTAKQVAMKTGINASALSNYQNTDLMRIPDSDAIRKLAFYFGVSTDYLYGLTHAKTSNMDTKAVCDITGLSAATIEELRKYQCSSLQSNFLRRFFEDLLIQQEIAEHVPKAIQKYALAKKAAMHETQSLTLRAQCENDEIYSLENGKFAIPTNSAAELFYGDAISIAQANIAGVIDEMCNEILRPYHVGPADENSIENHRWVIWSEADDTGK